MSKILSYNKKTTGEGWISLHHQYSTDEIEMIEDPNGGLAEQPRTAIPSPFAQIDLLKNAFKRLALSPLLDGDIKDKYLVSNALDVAQLFFNYNELKEQLSVVEWNRTSSLERLKATTQHKLLGETLEMFMEQDKESFNFELMDKLYIIMSGNQVIGSTSPVTLFLASPNAKKDWINLPIEQNIKAFSEVRMLAERDARFIRYIYTLFTANPSLKQQCEEMNNFLVTSFSLLHVELQREILNEIGNPTSLDLGNVDKAKKILQQHYSLIEGGVQVLGLPFYCLKKEDIISAIEQSDFRIVPTKKVEGLLPLVLQNNLSNSQTQSYRYITSQWNDTITINPTDCALEPEKRTLPGTTHTYPWLTVEDFLEPSLVKLDYTLNKECFFDGNLSLTSVQVDDCDFLLPIKPLFFHFFSVKDLKGRIGGHPCFEMRHKKEGVIETLTAILRIPVQKQGGYITLQRTYLEGNGIDMAFDFNMDKGRFVRLPFALNIFPFVQTRQKDSYSVQLIDRTLGILEHHSLSLNFYSVVQDNFFKEVYAEKRTRSLKIDKRVGTDFYCVKDNFDCIKVSLRNGKKVPIVEGIIIPNWVEYVSGHERFTFAVDFGTTNTHLEVVKEDGMPQPFSVNSVAAEKLIATLYNGENILYDALLKQEFLPKFIGDEYHFPLRTVLSENNRLDVEHIDQIITLADTNIPFSYEKESIGYGNRIIPNLKWSSDISASKRVKAFLTELALLMKTKIMLEHGDIAKSTLVWFYPLSMKVGNIRKLEEMWTKVIAEIWGVEVTSDTLIQMPESVAPYYYYKSSSNFRALTSTIASIDIGGGTSDIAVFDGSQEMPLYLSSFRFAANSLFGDAFADIPQGDKNPLLKKYVDYFKHLFDADEDKYGELNSILNDIIDKRKSEEINAFLFSIINHNAVKGNDVFSYNTRLNEDPKVKIIFLYFYVALIYYVAITMKHLDIEKPRNVMFSGTGSKVLDIVGSKRELDLLTQTVIEKVYNEQYAENTFSIILERKEPKQITCRGGLMQVKEDAGKVAVQKLNSTLDRFDSKLIANFSMIDKTELIYGDMKNQEIQDAIVERVRIFNKFFISLCEEIKVVNRFLVDNQSFQLFKEIVNLDLSHYLLSGWKFINKNSEEKNDDDIIEDTLFFYPIIGSIRNNLIEKLLN